MAELYLERKQKERGERIPHDQYPDELQRTKRFITDRNVYGVDLNPVAVELAGGISLVELDPSGWACALVRVPVGVRQLTDWCPEARVRQGSATQQRSEATGTRRVKSDLWFNEVARRE